MNMHSRTSRVLVTIALSALALAACGKKPAEEPLAAADDPAAQAAAEEAADLQARQEELARREAELALKAKERELADREALLARANAPKPAPKPAAPAPAATPAPAPAPAPAPTLAAGTSITATTDAEIRSRKNKVGDEVTATVASDVKDKSGRTVIPAGSKVILKVTAIKPSDSKSDTTGTLTLDVVGVEVGGTEKPVVATISGVRTKLEGSGTDANDVAKVAGGTAAGAIVGRVLGGSSKGAIIGGIIGGAVGTQRAIETKDRDVVLTAGTRVTLTLDQALATS